MRRLNGLTKRNLQLLASALALLLPAIAAAQEETDQGRARVLAWNQDYVPVERLRVKLGGIETHTDENGAATLTLPAGEHEMAVGTIGKTLAYEIVPILPGAVTEVRVRVVVGDTTRAYIETSVPRERAQTDRKTGPKGVITGVLRDAESGEPVSNAAVYVAGHGEDTMTDEAGRFRIEVPAGNQMLTVMASQYGSVRRDIAVPADGTVNVELEAQRTDFMLDDIVVGATPTLTTGIGSVRKTQEEDSTITVISPEDIARSGDSDVGALLRRATGLTVVGGRYVYVRGMGERYSTSLLNGMMLPSPEPERRVVPLDIFPTDMIQSVEIHKTYSASMPGEFGGGAVVLTTRGMPETSKLSASISTGFNTTSTAQEGQTYEGGDLDFLGFDDGRRALPDKVESAADAEPLELQDAYGDGYSAAELAELSAVMPNVWSPREHTLPPSIGLDFTIGQRYRAGGGRYLGYLLGMTYGNGWSTSERTERGLATTGTGLIASYDYDVRKTTHEIDVGAIFDAAYEIDAKQNLRMTALLVRTTEDETEVAQGYYSDDDTDIRVTTLQWVEQTLLNVNPQARLTWGPTFWDLSYAGSTAWRYEPDRRRTRYDWDDTYDLWLLSDRIEGNNRYYNNLDDTVHDLQTVVFRPYKLGEGREAEWRAGVGAMLRNRQSETRKFRFDERYTALDPNLLSLPPELIFRPINFNVDTFLLTEYTQNTDSYEAEQQLYSTFLEGSADLRRDFSMNAGLRVEDATQEVTTGDLYSNTAPDSKASLSNTDLLPALNATYRFHEKPKAGGEGTEFRMQLRGGYSRTLSRPEFRELSSAPYDKLVGSGQHIGNPDLKRTLIDNLDLRWEYYPEKGETFSLGVFYKQLSDPIELTVEGGANTVLKPQNTDSARNFGAEFEVRQQLDELFPHFYVTGNAALIQSDVTLSDPGIATSKERALQGQSEYVVNLGIGYDNKETKTHVSLLYNVYGERIASVGTYGLPDIYEQPVHQLDLVASWKLRDNWSMKFKLKNLLNEDVEFTQGGVVTETYEKGISGSIGLSWSR